MSMPLLGMQPLYIECPHCKQMVRIGFLRVHQSRGRCAASQKLRRAGYVPCHSFTRTLRNAGIPIRYERSPKKRTVTERPWGPRWAVLAAEACWRLQCPTYKQLQLRHRLLLRVKKDRAWRESLESAFLLGGQGVVDTMVHAAVAALPK